VAENDGRARSNANLKPFVEGNPGRPKGTRNKVTLAVEALIGDEAETITRKVIDLAKTGDLTAIRICIDRFAPARRDSPVAFELPKLSTAADAVKASAAIVEAVAIGELTPSEAAELAKVVDGFTRAVEAAELEQRLTKLEQAIKK
jgi:hypothetical protein